MTSQPADRLLPGLCIDGVWEPGEGSVIDIVDPSTEALLARIAAADAAAVDRAVRAAKRAAPAWRRTAPGERAAILRSVARAIEASAETLAAIQCANNGKPRGEVEFDIADAVATWDYYADLCAAEPGLAGTPVALPDPAFTARVVMEPVGVVGLIVPWNFPMVTTAWKLAPALAAGCTVVLKPSELTPLAESELLRILHAAGVPTGVVQMVIGTGAEVGAALAAHPLVDKVSFTGSTAVGRTIMATAAVDIRRVGLELGGKSSLIVFDDADLDLAVDLAVKGAFFNAGQMCSATSRVLVQRGLHDRFVARFVAATEALVVGGPSEGADVGPLIGRAQRDRVEAMVERGIAEGARLLTGGRRRPGPGWFWQPTILTDVAETSAPWRDEIFGPVACVRAFDDEAEATALAEDTIYGLVASVVTADAARADRLAEALGVGMVWVNAPQVIFPATAWGGFRQSGIGRELGPWGLYAFQEVKHVVSAVPTR